MKLFGRSRTRPSLVIYDDLFPYPVSGFRLAEYEAILKRVPGSLVGSTLSSLSLMGSTPPAEEVVRQWRAGNPESAQRLMRIEEAAELPPADAYYTIFLNNAIELASVAEQRGTPFSFTLYPGGGLALGDEYSRAKLSRVLASPALDRVIVTQPVVRQYLAESLGVRDESIEYVFGNVLGGLHPDEPPPRSTDTSHVSLGFVANRYHSHGHDKGLDVFLETTRLIAAAGVAVTAHLVGQWSPADIPAQLQPLMTCHGPLAATELRQLLRDIDICLFPTRAGLLGSGSFDGYPTGSAVEAALAGCLVVTTNPLGQSTPLVSGRDVVEIPPDAEAAAAAILALLRQGPDVVDQVRRNGQSLMRTLYSDAAQIEPRIRVMEEMLGRA